MVVHGTAATGDRDLKLYQMGKAE